MDPGLDALDPRSPHAAIQRVALPAIGENGHRHSLPVNVERTQSDVSLRAGFGSVYMKVWSTLCAMSREPHPQLAQMASDIISYVSSQVDSVAREPERPAGGSSSLPPSPNTRPTLPHLGMNGHTLPKSITEIFKCSSL